MNKKLFGGVSIEINKVHQNIHQLECFSLSPYTPLKRKNHRKRAVFDGFRPFTSKSADRTGLEPATPCVTGTYSNQLNYRSVFAKNFFCSKACAKVTPFLVSASLIEYFFNKKLRSFCFTEFLCFHSSDAVLSRCCHRMAAEIPEVQTKE